MAEPDSFILTLLREMRAETKEGFEGVNARFDRMEKRIDAIKQAAFGESLMARYTVAEVEDRLQEIEKRLAALERPRS